MTPIISRDDHRLVTLVGVAINVIEELAVITDCSPNEILSEYLYLTSKKQLEMSNTIYMNKLATHYPILDEAIS